MCKFGTQLLKRSVSLIVCVCAKVTLPANKTSKHYIMDLGAKICIIRTHGIVISE